MDQDSGKKPNRNRHGAEKSVDLFRPSISVEKAFLLSIRDTVISHVEHFASRKHALRGIEQSNMLAMAKGANADFETYS